MHLIGIDFELLRSNRYRLAQLHEEWGSLYTISYSDGQWDAVPMFSAEVAIQLVANTAEDLEQMMEDDYEANNR